MTIDEFTYRLAAALNDCPPDEIQNAVEYYTELIEDSDDPAEQMSKLGEPEQLAEHIRLESGWIQPSDGVTYEPLPPPDVGGFSENTYGRRREKNPAGKIAALICTSPLWIAAYALLGSLFAVIWAVYLFFPLMAVSSAVTAVSEMRYYFALGIMMMSAAAAFAGLWVIWHDTALYLTRLTAYGIKKFTFFLFCNGRKATKPEFKKRNKAVLSIGLFLTLFGIVAAAASFMFGHITPEKYAQRLGLSDLEFTFDSDFENIDIDLVTGNVKIYGSESGKIRIKGKKIDKNKLSLNTNGDTLEIKYDPKMSSLSYDILGIKRSIYGEQGIELYLPYEKYDLISAKSELGSTQIKDVDCEKVYVNCECGDTSIEDVKSGSVTVEQSLGKLTMENVTADNADIINDCGDVTMKNCKVEDLLSGELELGSANIEKTTVGTIDVKLSCGDLKFTGDMTKSGSEITLDVGNVNMLLYDEDYNVHANTDVGDEDIDRRFQNGGRIVNITNDCGDVSVKSGK